MRIACLLACAFGMTACFSLPSSKLDSGPYGDFCALASTGEHHCGICSTTDKCIYCPDVNGAVTCSADVCKTTCDSTGSAVPFVNGAGGSGGSGGGAGAGGSGGTGGSGGSGTTTGICNSTCPAMCPAGAQYECSQWIASASGNCMTQSCTCYDGTPTAYCGIFFRDSTGGFYWCGGGYNESCGVIDTQACVAAEVNACP